MGKIPFNEKEMEIVKELPPAWEGDPPIRRYNRPISIKENTHRFYRDRKAVWLPMPTETKDFNPRIIPDNIARAFVFEEQFFDNDNHGGGPDMYGTEWEYVPSAGGSMVRPGQPRFTDANEWKNVITRPDVDSWDWEGSAKESAEYLGGEDWIEMQLLSGAWFERLISFMDFENAALALIDEEQQDAVHEIFEATTDDLMKIVDKIAKYFPQVDCLSVHDDWGAQGKPFFSQESAMEMIVPHMKRLVDHIHEKGMVASLHSCGHTESRIEAYIAAGWDYWQPQPMNDMVKLYEGFGDKIIIGVNPIDLPDNMEGEEGRKMARWFMETCVKPGKIALPSFYFTVTKEFEEELYRLSRAFFLDN